MACAFLVAGGPRLPRPGGLWPLGFGGAWWSARRTLTRPGQRCWATSCKATAFAFLVVACRRLCGAGLMVLGCIVVEVKVGNGTVTRPTGRQVGSVAGG